MARGARGSVGSLDSGLLVVGRDVSVAVQEVRWVDGDDEVKLACRCAHPNRTLEYEVVKGGRELRWFADKVRKFFPEADIPKRSKCGKPEPLTFEQVDAFMKVVFSREGAVVAATEFISDEEFIQVDEDEDEDEDDDEGEFLEEKYQSITDSDTKRDGTTVLKVPLKSEGEKSSTPKPGRNMLGEVPKPVTISRRSGNLFNAKSRMKLIKKPSWRQLFRRNKKGDRELDKLLSGFLQLSRASFESALKFEGKFPEGFMRKAPMLYHEEVLVMNIIVVVQTIVMAAAITITYFFWDKWSWYPLWIGAMICFFFAFLHVYYTLPSGLPRTTVIPCCSVPIIGQLVVIYFTVYEFFIRKKERRWIAFRPEFIAYFRNQYERKPRGVFMLDRNTRIRSPWLSFFNPLVIEISNQDQTLYLHADTVADMKRWRAVIENTCSLHSPRRFHLPSKSFRQNDRFGLRSGVPAQWYADAKFLYEDIYYAIMTAQHEVYITGWMISPELKLMRDDDGIDSTLVNVLGQAVDRGVKVCVLLYHDLSMALPNNSSYVSEAFVSRGIQIIRHAALSRSVGKSSSSFCSCEGLCSFGIGGAMWSHHEKIVCVDQAIAFVGGIDLAFGRFDDNNHDLEDRNGRWPGKDFYNVRIKDFIKLEEPDVDLLDREKDSRMPWHDIHCAVGGNAASDVSKHFIARWNRELRQGASEMSAISKGYRFLLPTRFSDSVASRISILPYTLRSCKVLRSVGPWSLTSTLENSIKDKYIELIYEAERLIYIENQFFNAPGVAQAIADRIGQALDDDLEFRVIVVLPQWPGFEGMPFDNVQTKVVLRFQHETMDLILSRIRSHPKIRSEEDLANHISFNALRKVGTVGGKVTSEQIYVHSKLMIVDDEHVIIGSANLNQRSLRGDRDSEVCLYLHDETFARDLRLSLFVEHLGLHDRSCAGCRMCSVARRGPDIELPASATQAEDALAPLWNLTANKNADIFEKLFPRSQPSDKYRTAKLAREAFMKDEPELGPAERDALLAEIRGSLSRTPLGFLRDDKSLMPSIFSEFFMYCAPTSLFV